MTSPRGSLRKTKRSPLPGISSRSPLPEEDTRSNNSLPEPIHFCVDNHTHLGMNTQRHRHREQKSTATTPTDSELLVSMAARLSVVEKELLLSKQELGKKNEYIHVLELRLAGPQSQPCSVAQNWTPEAIDSEQHRQALQKQVDQMEEFLNDYGMVWVGGESKRPPSSDVCPPLRHAVTPKDIDYDRIIKNIEQLNILAGEGSSKVTGDSQRATLKTLDSVPLTLYYNGLALYQGPFRPYSDPSTRQFIQDLSNGYFPAELQPRYPEGVPLVINDQRDVWFCSRQSVEHFPGSGRLLGGDMGPSRILLAGSEFRTPPRGMKETSRLPGKTLSLEQLLSRLPHSVVRGGRVLEIRGGIRDSLQTDGSGHNSGVMLVDTPVLMEMKNRLEVTEDLRPPTPSHLTTLRVKAETGEQTYIMKMKYTESIGDLRTYLNKLRSMNSPCDYVLKTTFPSRVLDNLSATLVDCALVPTATVYMVRRTSTTQCSKNSI